MKLFVAPGYARHARDASRRIMEMAKQVFFNLLAMAVFLQIDDQVHCEHIEFCDNVMMQLVMQGLEV